MNFHQLTVSYTVTSGSPRPRISFYCSWLSDMGFTPGALVKVLTKPGEMSFILCDESNVKEKNETFVKVLKAPSLSISEPYIHDAGWDIDDSLLARYEYGLIQVRKLPPSTIIMPAAAARKKEDLRLSGSWLASNGFVPDSVVTVASEPGSIVIRLYENGVEKYVELVKYARQKKLKILQVRKGLRNRFIDVAGSCLNKAGFSPDGQFLASYDYGLIKLQRLNFIDL